MRQHMIMSSYLHIVMSLHHQAPQVSMPDNPDKSLGHDFARTLKTLSSKRIVDQVKERIHTLWWTSPSWESTTGGWEVKTDQGWWRELWGRTWRRNVKEDYLLLQDKTRPTNIGWRWGVTWTSPVCPTLQAFCGSFTFNLFWRLSSGM